MKNRKMVLEKQLGEQQADEYFMELCGYDRGSKVAQKGLKRGRRALEDIYDDICLEAVVSRYPARSVEGEYLMVEGRKFHCKALSQIAKNDIVSVYMYLLTAGDRQYEEAGTLEQVYYDNWQSAYVQAGKDVLAQQLRQELEDRKLYFSPSFAPGFYGMEITYVRDFLDVLDGESIGMHLLDNGLMYPVKSYAGFYVVTGHVQTIDGDVCENCMAQTGNCSRCRTRRKTA